MWLTSCRSYMAPEVLQLAVRPDPVNGPNAAAARVEDITVADATAAAVTAQRVCEKADVWSLGVCLFELAAGENGLAYAT
jgi:serine/threonine protein kinase